MDLTHPCGHASYYDLTSDGRCEACEQVAPAGVTVERVSCHAGPEDFVGERCPGCGVNVYDWMLSAPDDEEPPRGIAYVGPVPPVAAILRRRPDLGAHYAEVAMRPVEVDDEGERLLRELLAGLA